MTTKMSEAQALLFGKSGLGVSNIKFFTGSNREATPEDIAAEVVRVLGAITEADEFEPA
jgi:hypothetical protein